MFPHVFKFFTTTSETWEAMLATCEEAKVSIDIEQYIFMPDTIGTTFLNLLMKKREQDVKVRLLLDTAGSYEFYGSSWPGKLRKLGIEVRFFNIISPWRMHKFLSWFFRNHKKTVVIDSRVAFVGGVGIADHMKAWRDTTARLEGDVCREISSSFDEMWGIAPDRDPISKYKKFKSNTRKANFVTNAPYLHKRFLYHIFIEALCGARKSILLTTPYFIPDRKLIRVLRRASLRGVDVKIIVPDTIDVPIVAMASRSSYGSLLRSGVRIFKYRPTVLHAKTIIVDDNWASYGSFNLDSLSFLYNFEGNIVSMDTSYIEQLKNHFVHDLENSTEILYRNWKQRPFIEKIQEFFVSVVRGLL